MSVENQNRRFGVVGIALSTIGVLAILFVVLFCFLITYGMHALSGSVQTMVSSNVKSAGSKINYAVHTKNSKYIAGVKLSGEILNSTADEVLSKLQTASEDAMAIGILLEVNSPGGLVVPSQEIYDKIKTVKAIKPVVVYVRELAASGAYYSSASAHKIIANRGSIIGSIGVIMQGFEANKLVEFLKITPVTIKTGALKDTGSPLRPMNENDKKYLQDLIEANRSQFVADVKEGRSTTEEAMNFMSDGRVVLAPQALKLKLIDEIGSKDVALEEIKKLAKVTGTTELFYYEKVDSLQDLISQSFAAEVSNLFKNEIMFKLR